MEGGIHAWHGRVAEGTPQSGMVYFLPAATPEDLIALAWSLEDGSRIFYAELVVLLTDPEAKELYGQLAGAEEEHQAALFRLYMEFSGRASAPGFQGMPFSNGEKGDVMEGGMRVDEALQWAKGKKTEEILELSLSLETNSYDLYLNMARRMNDERSAQVFRILSREEKRHLEQLGSLIERRI